MKNKVEKFILRHHMISEGDRIVVALSGGADSVALLRLLLEMREEYDFSLSACHVNHGIRPRESDQDEAFVVALCELFQIPLQVFHLDVPAYCQEHGISIELGARIQRYEAFDSLKDVKIATAHTLSDNLETVLFSLFRGTGLKGLCGIPPIRLHYIRPLLTITRQEVEGFLKGLEQNFVVDSSNFSLEHTRNRLRLQLVPMIMKWFPSADQAISRMVDGLQQDQEFLSEQYHMSLATVKRSNGYGVESFLRLHPAMKNRILIELLKEHQIPYDYQQIQTLNQLIDLGKGKIALMKDCYFQVMNGVFDILSILAQPKNQDVFYFSPLEIQKKQLSSIPLDIFGDRGNLVVLPLSEIRRFSHKKHTTYYLDYDKMDDTFLIRFRNQGDRIALSGRSGHKSLKKLFNELKIPLSLRSKLVVIEDSNQVVLVERCGVNERVAVDDHTKKVIVVAFQELQ